MPVVCDDGARRKRLIVFRHRIKRTDRLNPRRNPMSAVRGTMVSEKDTVGPRRIRRVPTERSIDSVVFMRSDGLDVNLVHRDAEPRAYIELEFGGGNYIDRRKFGSGGSVTYPTEFKRNRVS